MALAPTDFPQELIDLIADELYDNSGTLKNLSLAFRRCTRRAQKHLYTNIRMDHPRRRDQNGDTPLQKLVEVLTTRPDLACHIRTLYIGNYAEVLLYSNIVKRQHTPNTDKVLPLLFQRLHKLQSFTLHVGDDNDMEFGLGDPERLSLPFITAFITMLRSTQVEELNLHMVQEFPVALLSHCPDIKRLDLSYCMNSLYTDQVADTVSAQLALPASDRTGYLERLNIEGFSFEALTALHATTKLPNARLTFSRLREIAITGSYALMFAFVNDLVTEVEDSLEQLSWEWNIYASYPNKNEFQPGRQYFTLPSKLRSLRLSFMHAYDCQPSHLDWFCSGIRKMAGSNKLEEVILVLTEENGFHRENANTSWIWGNCARQLSSIDSLLGGSGYMHLRRFAIFIELTSFYDHDADEWVPISYIKKVTSQLEDMLPLLLEQGVLSVQWLITEKRQLALGIAIKALEEEVMGGVHVGMDGHFKIGREYNEKYVRYEEEIDCDADDDDSSASGGSWRDDSS